MAVHLLLDPEQFILEVRCPFTHCQILDMLEFVMDPFAYCQIRKKSNRRQVAVEALPDLEHVKEKVK